jgi:hypothetical protein
LSGSGGIHVLFLLELSLGRFLQTLGRERK